MNAIIGFTGLAESHVNDANSVREDLAIIAQSSEYLLSLINEVLDMSRIEAGKMNLHEKPESLSDILHLLGDIVKADVDAKRHTFSIEMKDVRNETVCCDKLRLNQVLLNLVSNAIKYTEPGGRISLSVSQKADPAPGRAAFEFRCKDNGIGMGEDFIGTIFDPFTREENSTGSNVPGSGLGMAIAKKIVEMMGGTISVASKKGEGTEFTVRLDFRIADRPANDEAVGQGRDVSLKGMRVLLVDDNELNRKIGVLQLQAQGMTVETAPGGQEAVGIIRDKGADAYDFVLMDIQMPGIGGYEATSMIRGLPGGDRLKIIAYSANAFEEDRERPLKAGMDGHIAKPLTIKDLMDELRRFLN